MASEKWKVIPNTGGEYLVSSLGRVRSVDRVKANAVGAKIPYKGKIIKQFPNSKGYFRVQIREKGVLRRYFVHRLVAEAFIPNPDGLDTVNHKDFNPQNNEVSNLEWTTRAGNMRYSVDAGRFKRTPEWLKKLKSSLDLAMAKSIVGTNVSDGKIVFYRALNDCARDGFQPSCVSCCCNGKRDRHKGYTWRFATDAGLSLLKEEWGNG